MGNIEEFSETERRLLRHNNIYNNDSEQEDNSNINENDIEIDFRIYPLNINWCNIYSTKNDSCKHIPINFR